MLTTFLWVEYHWGRPPGISFSSMVLEALSSSFQNADQERHYLLCPVLALDAYIHGAALWRKNEQLFICFGPPNQESPASKQRMSKWVVEAISLAYELAGQTSPQLSGPTRPGVWRPPRSWYQELLSKRFVMRQAGPHRTYSSDVILWTWTPPQVPKCSRPSAAR